MNEQQPNLAELFTTIDNRDTESFLDWLTPDAVLQFGAAAPVQGRESIGVAVGEFFVSVAGIKHDIGNHIRNGAMLACEGLVTYTRHNDSMITLPFANFFELDGSLIRGYRIYIDIGPLYASSQ